MIVNFLLALGWRVWAAWRSRRATPWRRIARPLFTPLHAFTPRRARELRNLVLGLSRCHARRAVSVVAPPPHARRTSSSTRKRTRMCTIVAAAAARRVAPSSTRLPRAGFSPSSCPSCIWESRLLVAARWPHSCCTARRFRRWHRRRSHRHHHHHRFRRHRRRRRRYRRRRHHHFRRHRRHRRSTASATAAETSEGPGAWKSHNTATGTANPTVWRRMRGAKPVRQCSKDNHPITNYNERSGCRGGAHVLDKPRSATRMILA